MSRYGCACSPALPPQPASCPGTPAFGRAEPTHRMMRLCDGWATVRDLTERMGRASV